MSDQLVRLPEALRITGFKRTKFLEEVKRGNLPKKVKLSERCVAWKRSELEKWVDSLEEA